MPSVQTPAAVARAYWKPLLIRAALAAAVGLTSVFWAAPPLQVLGLILAAFFVANAALLRRLIASEETPGAARVALAATAVAWLAAGVVLVFLPTVAGVTAAAAAGWIAGGAGQIAAWARTRKAFVPARDWALTGLVETGIGVGLLLFWGVDAHGIFGIGGGGQVIVAVFVAIAALGYRHDAVSTPADR